MEKPSKISNENGGEITEVSPRSKISKENGGEITEVSPRPKKGAVSYLIDLAEKLVVRTLYGSPQPLHYLSGNFAPAQHEIPPRADLPVIGYLPKCLDGEFVRVGPNPKFSPVAGYHWFDGDGMVHGLRIKDGKATYVSRFVKTSRLKQEEYFGAAKFMKIGDLKGLFGMLSAIIYSLRVKLGVLDGTYGMGAGNTALIYHHGRLLALNEGDKPYVLRVLEDGDLQTLGLMDYDKRLTHSFTAHPKVDPITGEMFTFGYQFTAPYVTYHVVTKEGCMLDPVPITIPEPVMMHDFAITKNYAIFMDLPLYFHPKNMMKGKFILTFDQTKKARFGVLPRYSKNDLQMRWFELPNCYIFHNGNALNIDNLNDPLLFSCYGSVAKGVFLLPPANAWEEGDEIILYTCRLLDLDLEMAAGPVKENLKNYTNEFYEMRFNLKTGDASQKKLSESAVDFPRINENYIGRKQRFVYGTILDSLAKVKGVAKFDLQAEPEVGKKRIEVGGNVKGIFEFGPGRFGSEAIFVPRESGVELEEDDGYLICFVHDENTGKSEVNVIDARTMSSTAIAIVPLPARVPYGFHAFFVTEEQLKHQA